MASNEAPTYRAKATLKSIELFFPLINKDTNVETDMKYVPPRTRTSPTTN